MKYNLTKILEIAGIGLIVLAVGTMLLSGGLQKHWASEARQTAEILYSYLPPVQNGIPEERTNPAMPVLEIDGRGAYDFGFLVYFFELACAVSGYTLGVNPFDQPGVEGYKNNMYALLGKPGAEHERRRKELKSRIN